MDNSELNYRKQLARQVLSFGTPSLDEDNLLQTPALAEALNVEIPFPEGLAAVPEPIQPTPQPEAPLPKADIVVLTWTVAESEALADVFTAGFSRESWYKYDRFFQQKYAPQIRRGAPAASNKRLGSYFLAKVADKTVLLFKSELHLNQDGIRNYQGSGQTSLPVRDLLKQIIQETGCSHILSVGTCGAIHTEHSLGDVLVTRAAKFRCAQEFRDALFNHKKYTSEWNVPTKYFLKAEEIMGLFSDHLKEPVFGPPTKRHHGGEWKIDAEIKPQIIHEARDDSKRLPEYHPILTTDYFEFGHSRNADELWRNGCGVEMGDAVLGLVCAEDLSDPPKWLVIRNLSDPQINGDITTSPRSLNMQIHWAVWYYEAYGYWTSIMSSLTTWAVVAALAEQ